MTRDTFKAKGTPRRAGASAPTPSPAPSARDADGEKPIGWWNGIKPDELGRDFSEPSIRWGADKENSGHDIPLYAGFNPIHSRPPASVPVAEFRAAVLAVLNRHTTEMEGYGYYSSNPGIPEDSYEEIADELTALAQKGDARGQG